MAVRLAHPACARTTVILALCALSLFASGCGGGDTSKFSKGDEQRLHRMRQLVRVYITREAAIGADTIAGSKIRGPEEYVRVVGPKIHALSGTVQSLRTTYAELDDPKLASLYVPLVEAVDREASDLELFLNTVKQHDAKGVQRVYARIGADERRVNNVVLEQLPKAKAYAKKLGG
jgi:hypothetical protein